MNIDHRDDSHAAARADARARLLGHIDLHDSPQGEMQGGPGGYSEEAFAELGRLVDALKPLTPIPAPMDAQERAEVRKQGFPAALDALLGVHGCGDRRERFE
ncbi:MAG: hypothetical protein EBV29_09240, partial [Gammaproteobacteria bacterium]|nr:hypothetical protein [Gammaproteobacteria bacterium]